MSQPIAPGTIANKVEAMLRSWAGNLRNGAYRKRVTQAADEIKALRTERDELRDALDDAHAFVKHTLEFFDWYKWPNVHEAVKELDAKLSAVLAKANPSAIPKVEITKHTTGMLPEIAGG